MCINCACVSICRIDVRCVLDSVLAFKAFQRPSLYPPQASGLSLQLQLPGHRRPIEQSGASRWADPTASQHRRQ